ncbi:hypothetical protein [Verrucomicrobium spinosum]|uniref:hypothetical protein n=1 Tax=Verrucomicrobium spinosum TaxID=2736 RepID=UPI001C449172|nr:hypothetical protein [Verrucomicrobium spinosum]
MACSRLTRCGWVCWWEPGGGCPGIPSLAGGPGAHSQPRHRQCLVYVVQGVMLTALCQPTIAEHPWLAGLGFAAGAGFFASVLPLMRATARLTA